MKTERTKIIVQNLIEEVDNVQEYISELEDVISNIQVHLDSKGYSDYSKLTYIEQTIWEFQLAHRTK